MFRWSTTEGRTTEPMLFGAGDCLGIKADPPDAAAAEGVRAARAAAAALAAGSDADWPKPLVEAGQQSKPLRRASSGRGRARSVAEADTHICQCEEVSLADLLGVRPPRYLGRDQPASGRATSPRSPRRGGSIRIRSSD